jgi:hypothetical protein
MPGSSIAASLDGSYWVEIAASHGSLSESIPHHLVMSAKGSDTLAFTTSFSRDLDFSFNSPAVIFENSAYGWQDYWEQGGVVQLIHSKDPRAAELERRIILSKYLMRINYAGSFPPAETGLTHLSWYGKHNSEVYLIHAAHWPLWGRSQYLANSIRWYQNLLPVATAAAEAQAFKGARWPKMAGIDGRPGPGTINPFIIWNQPNPIYLAELLYRTEPTRETLETYKDLVFASADFLASYAQRDGEVGHFHLGPPIKAVTESTHENETRNPTFELHYWYVTLDLALEWQRRLGLPENPHWKAVRDNLAPLPAEDDKYLEIESHRGIYQSGKPIANSMILAHGILPATPKLCVETMRRTVHAVTSSHPDQLGRWVSWSMGMAAMNYTRLGEPETAVSIVTQTTAASRFMPSGHVRRPAEPDGCVAYLPVNASFLAAIALMVAGWDGCERETPGFPDDGSWTVEWEGLLPMP